ncbi:succinylglutamate desuccinylase/aspartoacylase family protein [Alteromonadaceae bacterium BrNp21-10]|nr:succinylglutamate desuccinylase/aspartoacylase family protein [Alteromonadaceae bacterium BrNp21-10]
MTTELEIAGVKIAKGQRKRIHIPVSRLYTDLDVSIPVEVIRSKKDGPTLFVSAAIHGDELNGIDIIRRLLQRSMVGLKGTLIAVPIVNAFGVINQSRYMPDRRDLNRSFPGSATGSLAARTANLFFTEIVKKCDYGIDLHTGAVHRSNFPQIRANLSDPETESLAQSFGVPLLLNMEERDGSMRQSAVENGVKVLLYEAGQALRYDELSVRAGLDGIVNVMRTLGMLPVRKKKKIAQAIIARKSSWIRAKSSGFVHSLCNLGEHVKKHQLLAKIYDPFGDLLDDVVAERDGIIIGKLNIPLVQEGEAMVHIAYFSNDVDEVAEHVELIQEKYGLPPMEYET